MGETLSLWNNQKIMVTTFKSLIELNDYFKEEKTCFEFLASQIWDEGKPVCPFCDSKNVGITKSRSTKPSKRDIPEYRCRNKECAKKFSTTTGTIFESSKIPLRTWYAAIHLLTTSKKGISSVQLATQLGVTQKTAWFLNHRIRTMFLETAPEMLTGIVEADETYVGGKNRNRHDNKKVDYAKNGDEKVPVFGLLQRNGKVLTFVVPTTRREILQPIMQEFVDKDATLISDSHQGYNGLEKDYTHVVVKHRSSEGNYKTDSHFHTNNIENFWSTFKRGIIGIYHYVSPKHLHRYTDEFSYRYNNRDETPVVKFHDAVEGANKKRLTYNKLIGEGRKQKVMQVISIPEEEKSPEQKFYEYLDELNPDDIPFPNQTDSIYPESLD
jgi:transposase-like protein